MEEQIIEGYDIEKKEKEIKKKKSKFIKLTIVFFSFLAFLLAILASRIIYRTYFYIPKVTVQVTDAVEVMNKQENMYVKKTTRYGSSNLKLNLEYPAEAKLYEKTNTDQTRKIEVIFDKGVDNTENIGETNLADGYIFRVSTFTTSNRNLDQIVAVKRESFISMCPETSTISKAYGLLVNGNPAATFDIQNCGVDYIVTYVPKLGQYYEFLQILRGDVGIRQQYKSTTDELLNSVVFYPAEAGPETSYDVYRNEKEKFTFKHPKLKSDCCEVPPPVGHKGWIVTLANPETLDGISIYINSFTQGENFDSFLYKEKQTLIDDYIVVRGEQPKLEEQALTLGGKQAVLLKGYSWRGLQAIYVNMPKETSYASKVMIISVQDKGGNFKEGLQMILDSFEFF